MNPVRRLSNTDLLDAHEHRAGGKAAGLDRLARCGLPIPRSLILLEQEQFIEGAISEHVDWLTSSCSTKDGRLIVRSSSCLEDSERSSFAGQFKSIVTDAVGLENAILAVREHAMEKFGITNIAVIIQPLLEGPGGVFLYNQSQEKFHLNLSILGPSDITAGTNTPFSAIPPSDPTFEKAKAAAIDLTQKVPGDLDAELIVVNSKFVLFLQLRNWTGASKATGLLDIGAAQVNPLNEYFPRILPRLVGELWSLALSTRPRIFRAEYVSGTLVQGITSVSQVSDGAKDDSEPSLTIPVNAMLEEAERFYRDVLFPKWERNVFELEKKLSSITPQNASDVWYYTKNVWINFYDEYFHNQFEHVIDIMRKSFGAESGIPSNLAKLVNSSILHSRGSITRADWMSEYGKYFVDCHYFNEI